MLCHDPPAISCCSFNQGKLKTLNQAMQSSKEQGKESLTSHSFNAHGIVAKAQDVPDWFIAEGENSNAQHPHPGVQEAYQQGDLWFGHIRSARA